MLDPSDKQWLRATIAEELRKIIGGEPAVPDPLPRLTVKQFACAVEEHPDTIRFKIRTHDIPPAQVFGSHPKFISPKALDAFGVTQLQAKLRLASKRDL